MRLPRGVVTTTSIMSTALLGIAAVVGAAADDQARADEAVAAFGERIEELGFLPTGYEQPELSDDEPFDRCVEPAGLRPLFDRELPGESARARSDEHRFNPGASADVSHPGDDTERDRDDAGGWDFRAEFADATVIVVDGAAAGLEEAVEAITSDEFVDCVDDIAAVDFMSDIDDLIVEPTVQVEAASDLGVGSASGALSLRVERSTGVGTLSAASIFVATQDDSLVMVVHVTFFLDEPVSGIDPVAELEALLDHVTS